MIFTKEIPPNMATYGLINRVRNTQHIDALKEVCRELQAAVAAQAALLDAVISASSKAVKEAVATSSSSPDDDTEVETDTDSD